MKRTAAVLGLLGALLWSATIFLRGTALMEVPAAAFLLGVAPNFGAMWLGVGITFTLCPQLMKREFDRVYLRALLGLIFVAMAASEMAHHVLLRAGFDVWDMVSSLAAAAIVLAADWLHGKTTESKERDVIT